ncbi:MAG: hypothetical protein GX963_11725 [Bacteroidales bacterium]|jgi:uncharacterized protein YneF (UPF0154 family)|nr:hypothetical protein [Bacteroidales bacterium]
MKKQSEIPNRSPITNILIYICFLLFGLAVAGFLSHLVIASSSIEESYWTVLLIMLLSVIAGNFLGQAMVSSKTLEKKE